MPTKRRKCSSRPSRDPLPVDLLLEILARGDITTIIRCAATGRTLRRAILEPAFRRRLAAADDGCDPALLHAVSYLEHDFHKVVTTQRVIQTPPATTQLRARLDADSLQAPFKPVASRDGLLVLRRLGDRHSDKVELQARDTFTGHVTSLPPTTLPHAFLHAILTVDHHAHNRSFELLVADWRNLSYRTFSSKNRQWSDIREVINIPHPNQECDSSSCSAVIGRTVYWPCRVDGVHWTHILALQVDAGEATMLELPLVSQDPLLVARVRGRLSVLTEESLVIAMWTLTSAEAGTWSRQVVISKLEIARQVGLPSPTFIFEGFGERSGVLILNVFDDGYLLRLDLGIITREAPVVTWLAPPGNVVCVKELFLHEIDLISVLQAMKCI